MKVKLYEMLGRIGNEKGKTPSLQEVSEATGMSRVLLTDIRKNQARMLRPEHLDALAAYISEQLGEPISESDLISFEPIALPLDLNLRPDRQGKQVRRSAAATAQPTATTLRTRKRQALTPPPEAGAGDADRQAAMEERRAALLAQAEKAKGELQS